jgi:prophage DNA circulation protein
MATIQEVSPAPWRLQLRPASYAGIVFHVEHQARSGGRRVVLHEYPKRDTPYAEDMGRSAFRYQVTGYLIGPTYHTTKRALMSALDDSAGGTLVDPYIGAKKVLCERYSVTESRERGGYCQFEMGFVESGEPGNTPEQINSSVQLQNLATAAGSGIAASLNSVLNRIGMNLT